MRALTLSFLFLILTSACTRGGTGTGNPNHLSLGSDINSVVQLGNVVCKKIESCHGVTECWDGISAMTEFSAKLGVSENPAPTLIQLIIDEYDGIRKIDAEAASDCEAEVQALDCSDSAVVEAYDSNLANPFAKAAEVLGPSCLGFFQN